MTRYFLEMTRPGDTKNKLSLMLPRNRPLYSVPPMWTSLSLFTLREVFMMKVKLIFQILFRDSWLAQMSILSLFSSTPSFSFFAVFRFCPTMSTLLYSFFYKKDFTSNLYPSRKILFGRSCSWKIYSHKIVVTREILFKK